jgi:hypothetical protein
MLTWWNAADSVARFEQFMVIAVICFAALTLLGVCLLLRAFKRGQTMDARGNAAVTEQGPVAEETSDLRFKEDRQTESLLKATDPRLIEAQEAVAVIQKELTAVQKERDIAQQRFKDQQEEIRRINQTLATESQDHAPAMSPEHKQTKATRRAEQTNADPTLEEPKMAQKEHNTCLGADQREQLISLLDHGPKGEIDIIAIMGNEISHAIALELEALFKYDGWTTKKVVQSSFAKEPEGIILSVQSRETAPSYAPFIQRTFTTLGFKVSAAVNKKNREWSLTLIVGDVAKYLMADAKC